MKKSVPIQNSSIEMSDFDIYEKKSISPVTQLLTDIKTISTGFNFRQELKAIESRLTLLNPPQDFRKMFGAEIKLIEDFNQKYPLHWAVYERDIKQVETLISDEKDNKDHSASRLVNGCWGDGKNLGSALLWSCALGETQIVQILLNHYSSFRMGNSVNLLTLSAALESGKGQIVSALFCHSDTFTPLHTLNWIPLLTTVSAQSLMLLLEQMIKLSRKKYSSLSIASVSNFIIVLYSLGFNSLQELLEQINTPETFKILITDFLQYAEEFLRPMSPDFLRGLLERNLISRDCQENLAHWAVLFNRLDILSVANEYGLPLNTPDEWGRLPFAKAVSFHQPQIVAWWIDNVEDKNLLSRTWGKNFEDQEGFKDLLDMVTEGENLEFLFSLIDKFPNFLSIPTLMEYLLMVAFMPGKNRLPKWLITQTNIIDIDKELKPNDNLWGEAWTFRNHLTFQIIKQGNIELLPLLIDKPNWKKFSPVGLAITFNQVNALKFLLANNPDALNWKNPTNGKNLVQMAATYASIDILNYLLQKSPALFDQPSPTHGLTAIHCAANIKILKWFLDHYPQAYNWRSEQGLNLLLLGFFSGFIGDSELSSVELIDFFYKNFPSYFGKFELVGISSSDPVETIKNHVTALVYENKQFEDKHFLINKNGNILLYAASGPENTWELTTLNIQPQDFKEFKFPPQPVRLSDDQVPEQLYKELILEKRLTELKTVPPCPDGYREDLKNAMSSSLSPDILSHSIIFNTFDWLDTLDARTEKATIFSEIWGEMSRFLNSYLFFSYSPQQRGWCFPEDHIIDIILDYSAENSIQEILALAMHVPSLREKMLLKTTVDFCYPNSNFQSPSDYSNLSESKYRLIAISKEIDCYRWESARKIVDEAMLEFKNSPSENIDRASRASEENAIYNQFIPETSTASLSYESLREEEKALPYPHEYRGYALQLSQEWRSRRPIVKTPSLPTQSFSRVF